MATITKRNGRWQARVRRKGFPTQTKTFSQKTDAQKWVRHVEVKIETHQLPHEKPDYPNFRQAIERYSYEVSRFSVFTSVFCVFHFHLLTYLNNRIGKESRSSRMGSSGKNRLTKLFSRELVESGDKPKLNGS